MNLTSDVILDLLPLYLADEASPATRALVEHYLKEHPDLAERVRAAAKEPLAVPPASPPPDLELRSLRRTMRLLNWKHRLFALAFWLTGISLMASITFQGGHIHVHFFIWDYPAQLGLCAQLAVYSWIAFFILRYRLAKR